MNDAAREDLEVAVIGAGAAGLAAAHLLQRKHRVTVFEAGPRAGGHVNTVTIPGGPDAGTPVDTGFIVFNDGNYPLFNRLIAELGVEARYSDMSFSYYAERSGLQYAGTGISGLLADRRNALRPSYWRFIRGILRFCSESRRQLDEGGLAGVTLDEYLRSAGFDGAVADDYVLPLAGAIWSASRDDIRAFPAASLLRFFDNHGLLRVRERPQWKTIVGGSNTYVRKLLGRFKGDVEVDHAVRGVRRADGGVDVRLEDGTLRRFDRAVLAVHADQALGMLEDPRPEETDALGVWAYNAATAYLHTDAGTMPTNRRAWASWNYRRGTTESEDAPVFVTYYMNRLQGLRTKTQFFVSLNPGGHLDEKRVIREIHYTHPCFTQPALASQSRIANFSGTANTYYCGSYLGYGFHEDAVRSGVLVGRHFGIDL